MNRNGTENQVFLCSSHQRILKWPTVITGGKKTQGNVKSVAIRHSNFPRWTGQKEMGFHSELRKNFLSVRMTTESFQNQVLAFKINILI
jgi:hypothetical protein